MKLKISPRAKEHKKEAKRLRREGVIPAVLYDNKGQATNISILKHEYVALFRKIKEGCLSTTVFTLEGDGGSFEAIIKDIQYHRVTYDILHLDFQKLEKGVSINLNVPIHLTGQEDCVGIKLGGVPRRVIRKLRVNCLPEAIPSEFVLDIAPLKIKETRRLRDIQIPTGVRPLGKMDEVAIVIAKR